MSEPVQALQTMSRKQLIDELMRRGYYGPAVTAAANAILDGTDPMRTLAILEPEAARAYQTQAWLQAGTPLELEAPAELNQRKDEHGS